MIPSPPETRASLIVRLRDAADVAAWDEFVAIYGPLVYRLALRQGLQSPSIKRRIVVDSGTLLICERQNHLIRVPAREAVIYRKLAVDEFPSTETVETLRSSNVSLRAGDRLVNYRKRFWFYL